MNVPLPAGDHQTTGGAFLSAYFRGARGTVYLAAIRNGDSSLERGEIARLVTSKPAGVDEFIAQYDKPENEAAIYFTTATLKQGETRRVADNCRQFPSIFADIDDKGHDLDRDRVVDLLGGLECPPTMIVNSGHGLQPHWLLDEPSEDFKRIEAARKRLHAITASDAVHDAPRLMRLPGSHNSKYGDWLPVKVVAHHPERRYALEVLEEWLDTAEMVISRKPKPEKTNGAHVDFVLPPTSATGADHRRGSAWARAALEESARELANAGGATSRHDTLRDKAVRMGTMVARGWIDVQAVRAALFAASEACGQMKEYGPGHFEKTLADGLKFGLAMPHPDLPDNDPPRPDRLPGVTEGDPPPTRTTDAKKRFLFETVSDLRSMPPAEELIEGWIPERSVGLLYGKWGSFKTFIAFDWALHLAFGMKEWHGAKLPGVPCEVFIIAREGHNGFLRRVDAFKARHGLKEDPKNLVFMRSPISFLDDTGFAALKDEITALKKKFRFVVVDTVGRVLPGADMAKEQPITLFMERLQQIGEVTGGSSLGVHHENKSGDANGSMYFQNNSDFMFSTSRDGTSLAGTLTCAKQKDGEDGWSRQFKLTKVMFDDGKSSLAVEGVSGTAAAPEAKKTGWTKSLLPLRRSIDEAVLKHGIKHRPMDDGPEVRAVELQFAREVHKRIYVNTGDKERSSAERTAWGRSFKQARDTLIGCETKDGKELVWVVSENKK